MKYLFNLFILLCTNFIYAQNINKIAGGKIASIDYPWAAAIVKKINGKNHVCGSSVIASEWLLTAAHCVTTVNANDTRNYTIAEPINLHAEIGSNYLPIITDPKNYYAVDAVFVHPNFNTTTYTNDIALVKLATPTTVETIPIMDQSTAAILLKEGVLARLVGWGITNQDQLYVQSYLHEADIQIVDMTKCTQLYGTNIEVDKSICAGYPDSMVDSCSGDSGSPFMIEQNGHFLLAGLVSYGDGYCGLSQYSSYGIYIKVSAYLDWINNIMQGNVTVTQTTPDTTTSTPATELSGNSSGGGGGITSFITLMIILLAILLHQLHRAKQKETTKLD